MSSLGIIIAASNRGCNGAHAYARRIVPLLVARGHRVWVAAPKESWIASQTMGEAPLLATDFKRWPLCEFQRIAEFCRAESIDVFHSHLTRASNFGAILQLLYGINSVAHLHVNGTRLHVPVHRLVIGVSDYTMALHRRRFAGLIGQWGILYNFVDPTIFRHGIGAGDHLRKLLGVQPETPVILVAGTICYRKGQDLAARAIQILRQRHPLAILAVAGEGSWPEGTPKDGVVQLGYRSDLDQLLPYATAVIVPSRNEPFSLVAAEAMTCGVPVIATDVGGLNEVVKNGGGRIVPNEDVEAIARELIRLIDDPIQREYQAQAGRRNALERFAVTPHIEALEQLYKRAMSD